MTIYDMHCHLDLMPNMKNIIQESLVEDLVIIAVTTTPKAFEQEVNFCKRNSNIQVALGLHPQLVGQRFNELPLLLNKIQNVKFIGEIGLDNNGENISSREEQVKVFNSIIKECSALGNKVLSIHSVKSSQNVLDSLKLYNTIKNNICILHWFTGSEKQLNQAIELGCYFSINSKMLSTAGGKKVIQKVPEDKLLVETDAPFIRKISHCHEIYEELDQTIQGISNLRNRDLFQTIQKNSKDIIEY
ncbi:Tat-linked quality control protein TatD [compost metagenome]